MKSNPGAMPRDEREPLPDPRTDDGAVGMAASPGRLYKPEPEPTPSAAETTAAA